MMNGQNGDLRVNIDEAADDKGAAGRTAAVAGRQERRAWPSRTAPRRRPTLERGGGERSWTQVRPFCTESAGGGAGRADEPMGGDGHPCHGEATIPERGAAL